MADTTTELEVLDDIVDVLGGQSGQYETVVPTLRQIKELLGGGGAVPDGAVTFPKLSQDVQDAIEEGGSGYNPSLSAGSASALTGGAGTDATLPRTSVADGVADVLAIKGNTVVWNQLVGSDTSSVTVPSGHKYLGIIGGTSAIATSDGTAVSVTAPSVTRSTP